MGDFADAVNRNGVKQTIPTAWLDHPVLGQPFRLPPSAEAAAKKSKAPALETPTSLSPEGEGKE